MGRPPGGAGRCGGEAGPSAAASSPSSGTSLPSSRTCLIVTENLTATAASTCLPGMIPAHHPGPGPAEPAAGCQARLFPTRTIVTLLTSNNHRGHCRKHPETPGLSQYKRFIKKSADIHTYQRDAPVGTSLPAHSRYPFPTTRTFLEIFQILLSLSYRFH